MLSNQPTHQQLIEYLDAKEQNEHNAREDESRSLIAGFLTEAFVALFSFILITGIGINLFVIRQSIDISEIMTTFGSIFGPILSFVLGYYFGKDKR